MAFGFSDPVQSDLRRRAEANRLRPVTAQPQSFDQFQASLSQDTGGLMNRVGQWWDQADPFAPVGGRPEEPVVARPPAPWEYGPSAPSVGLPPETSGSYTPPGPPSMEQMSGVLSGASSTAEGSQSVGLPPPPQPSGLRVKLSGGDWQEADPDGRLPMPPTQRSSTAYDPVDRRVEQVSAPSGGGTFSMMTAPENESIVTRGSQLEDAEFASKMRSLYDPYEQQRAAARFQGDEQIRVEEAKSRIAMGKQAEMARESEKILAMSDQSELALAQKYGIDPNDAQGAGIPDEMRRLQFQQEREALKGEVEARMALLLSRYGMAPRNAAGYEAMRGF